MTLLIAQAEAHTAPDFAPVTGRLCPSPPLPTSLAPLGKASHCPHTIHPLPPHSLVDAPWTNECRVQDLGVVGGQHQQPPGRVHNTVKHIQQPRQVEGV